MRVLHVINSLDIGGAEKLLVDTIPMFRTKELDVYVLTLRKSESFFATQLSKEIGNNLLSLNSSLYNIKNIFKCISYLRKFDIVHVHLFPSLYYVSLAKMLSFTNVKLIFTEHSTDNRRLQNKMFRIVDSIIYSQYNIVSCITKKVKESLLSKLFIDERKLCVIENGVDLNSIAKAQASSRKTYGLSSSDRILVMVAGFRMQKDHETVVRALVNLPDNYKVIFAGDGERRAIVQHLVSELNLGNRVLFLGKINFVASLIKMSDVAILSSHWEGFGLAAAEAMACGIPLIASNVDGLSAVVEGGGILFEKGNAVDLASKIMMLEDGEAYEKAASSGLAKASHYDIGDTVNKTLDLYRKLLHG